MKTEKKQITKDIGDEEFTVYYPNSNTDPAPILKLIRTLSSYVRLGATHVTFGASVDSDGDLEDVYLNAISIRDETEKEETDRMTDEAKKEEAQRGIQEAYDFKTLDMLLTKYENYPTMLDRLEKIGKK